jgi:hypothetical protein
MSIEFIKAPIVVVVEIVVFHGGLGSSLGGAFLYSLREEP